MLDWILSHPQGQELIEGLSQDTIDKLAVDPMPPPQEPQPVVYGDSSEHFRELTHEEAKKIWEGIEPQEKPAYLPQGYQYKEDLVSRRTQNIYEVENMDWDLDLPEDGSAVQKAEAIKAIQDYYDYYYKHYDTDLDGDGYTSKPEAVNWIQNYFSQVPGSYSDIRAGLGYHVEELTWGSNYWWPFWSCNLRASPDDNVPLFIGRDETYGSITGWLNVHLHDYTAECYECRHFAADTAYCSYKSIGYGFFPIGISEEFEDRRGMVTHAYIMFLKYEDGQAGDWHDLDAWAIVEPQSGVIHSDASSVPEDRFKTERICFPHQSYLDGGDLTLACAQLRVDYLHGAVDYDPTNIYTLRHLNGVEELNPNVTFDTDLS